MVEERKHQEEMVESRRLTMAKERKHEEKMAEWWQLLRICRDEEQRFATQGMRGCASS